jgi:DHA2 family multidrug resistance protein
LIWELTDSQPIVDLRVFRHRGFTSAVITIALTFGAFFSSIVLVPLWLQTNMGYTASWAGYTTALGGVLAVVFSPIVPLLMRRFDSRALVSFGVLWLAGVTLIRTGFASNANYWTIALTFLAQGLAMPFFFIPTTQIALSSVLPQEMASAAGLQNFLRTTSAAFSTSIVTTLWDNASTRNHANMAGALNDPAGARRHDLRPGAGPDRQSDAEPGGDVGDRPDVLPDHNRVRHRRPGGMAFAEAEHRRHVDGGKPLSAPAGRLCVAGRPGHC